MKIKKIAALFMAVLMVSSLAACGNSSGKESAEKEDNAQSEEKTVKVGIVLGTGGLGDKNFNDMAYEGLTRAQEDLGIEFDYLEPETISDYLPNLRSMCESEEYGLIIGLGSDMGDAITDITADFPEQKFSHIDSSLEISNVSAVSTKWQEQTFLAGVMAGLGTLSDMEMANEDNVIGVILGQENPALLKGVVGYTAGAKYVNPDVEVLVGNVDSFADPDKGKEIAISMYNQGADFIQAIAGASGMGVYNASNEVGRYSFAVGANVNYLQADNIVATSARKVDEIVYNEVAAYLNGTWSAGVHVSGMAEGAVDYDDADSNVAVSDDIKAAINEIRELIKEGKLVPPETEEELDSWLAENQYSK